MIQVRGVKHEAQGARIGLAETLEKVKEDINFGFLQIKSK